MEQSIENLVKTWELVKYHDNRAELDKAVAYLTEMKDVCKTITEHCEMLIGQMMR